MDSFEKFVVETYFIHEITFVRCDGTLLFQDLFQKPRLWAGIVDNNASSYMKQGSWNLTGNSRI